MENHSAANTTLDGRTLRLFRQLAETVEEPTELCIRRSNVVRSLTLMMIVFWGLCAGARWWLGRDTSAVAFGILLLVLPVHWGFLWLFLRRRRPWCLKEQLIRAQFYPGARDCRVMFDADGCWREVRLFETSRDELQQGVAHD